MQIRISPVFKADIDTGEARVSQYICLLIFIDPGTPFPNRFHAQPPARQHTEGDRHGNEIWPNALVHDQLFPRA